jgi:hypothetical protein
MIPDQSQGIFKSSDGDGVMLVGVGVGSAVSPGKEGIRCNMYLFNRVRSVEFTSSSPLVSALEKSVPVRIFFLRRCLFNNVTSVELILPSLFISPNFAALAVCIETAMHEIMHERISKTETQPCKTFDAFIIYTPPFE